MLCFDQPPVEKSLKKTSSRSVVQRKDSSSNWPLSSRSMRLFVSCVSSMTAISKTNAGSGVHLAHIGTMPQSRRLNNVATWKKARPSCSERLAALPFSVQPISG